MNEELNPDSPLTPTELISTPEFNSITRLQIDLKNEQNRLATFRNRWPLSFISPNLLAKAGFYYLNVDDQVKCAYCGGIIGQWEMGDDPLNEHKKFFPDCPIVRQNIQDDEDIGIQTVKAPKAPEFSTLESRQRSFLHECWNPAVQDPTILSQAGFYYLGLEDEVRCFYCNGGLRNWLESDDPWYEHTRWFPKCPYVELVKGSNYIKNVLQRSESGGDGQSTGQSAPPPPTISIDDAMCSQPATDALQMGLNAGRVRLLIQRKINLTGRNYTNTEALVTAVLDGQIEDEGFELVESDRRIENQVTQLLLSAVSSVGLNTSDLREQQPSTSSTTITPMQHPKVPDDSTTAAESGSIIRKSQVTPDNDDNKRMKNVECKICMSEEVGVVFLPCGHLLSCVMCAPAMATCPLCRSVIKGRVRTFLS
ncbi:unnamed protein product [Diamesa hyperborea]